MRVFHALWIVLFLASLPLPTEAKVCALDPVPAASLLAPYFEVDLNGTGRNTVVAVGNASAEPQLVQVTIWTDLSVATLSFQLYLTGYDVATVSLREVFLNGVLPQTSPDEPAAGDFSLPNQEFPDCDLPLGNLPQILVDHLQTLHTGHASPLTNQCAGTDRGNNVAIGYITFDNVRKCSFLFPNDSGYFGPQGVALDADTLWGDYFLIDEANGMMHADPLVSVEADPRLEAGLGGPNQGAPSGIGYTFYGRYSSAAGGVDHREPLATTWAIRYLNAGAFTGGTDLLAWRDTGIVQEDFPCGTLPLPFPLNQQQIVCFDEDENPDLIEQPPDSPGIPGVDILPFPYETNRVEAGGPNFPMPFDFGWCFLELSTRTQGAFDPYKQAFITQVHNSQGLFQVGYSGIALDSACQPNELLLPVAGNVGGFPPGGTL